MKNKGPFHKTQNMIGKICYYRETGLKVIVKVHNVIEEGNYTNTTLKVIASTINPQRIQVGRSFTVSENNWGDFNQIWTLTELEASNILDAIQEADPKARYQWTTE